MPVRKLWVYLLVAGQQAGVDVGIVGIATVIAVDDADNNDDDDDANHAFF